MVAMRAAGPAARSPQTLDRGQLFDLEFVNHLSLDALRRGFGDRSVLMQWAGAVYVHYYMALLAGDQAGAREMGDHRVALIGLVERYKGTGRAAYSDREYEMARQCVCTMRRIASTTPLEMALQAAEIGMADLGALDAAI